MHYNNHFDFDSKLVLFAGKKSVDLCVFIFSFAYLLGILNTKDEERPFVKLLLKNQFIPEIWKKRASIGFDPIMLELKTSDSPEVYKEYIVTDDIQKADIANLIFVVIEQNQESIDFANKFIKNYKESLHNGNVYTLFLNFTNKSFGQEYCLRCCLDPIFTSLESFILEPDIDDIEDNVRMDFSMNINFSNFSNKKKKLFIRLLQILNIKNMNYNIIEKTLKKWSYK